MLGANIDTKPVAQEAGSRGSQHVASGLVKEDATFGIGRRCRAPQLLAQINTPLHGGTLFDRVAPTRDVGKFVQWLAKWFGLAINTQGQLAMSAIE